MILLSGVMEMIFIKLKTLICTLLCLEVKKQLIRLGGKIKLKVNPETQNGTKIRLKGKGFPVYKKEGEFGDLYITWNVKLPTQLN